MTILVVDDRRIFTKLPDDVLYARTIEAGLEVLRSGRPLAQLWLDHDLGEIDGRPVDVRPLVTAIEERAFHGYPYDIGRVVIHSSNPEGARWIRVDSAATIPFGVSATRGTSRHRAVGASH